MQVRLVSYSNVSFSVHCVKEQCLMHYTSNSLSVEYEAIQSIAKGNTQQGITFPNMCYNASKIIKSYNNDRH